MVLGNTVAKLKTFVWILSHVYNLVSVFPKSIKLGQMTTGNVFFHVVVSVNRFFKI